MTNIFLELERLRASLIAKGYNSEVVESIVAKAEQEINNSIREKMDAALEIAIQSGVQKDSPEFINDLRPSHDAFQLETESSNTDFSDPPFPMLDRLLSRSAKPMKDGSGVYKVIPVGGNNGEKRPPIHTNIFDAQKAIMAERYENSLAEYNRIAPKDSAVKFRTATSKQNRSSQWVMPAKEKDFTEDLRQINDMLKNEYADVVAEIIKAYEDGF